MNDLGFHKAVVIFIDILGTKDRVEFNEWFQITDIFYNSVECEKQLDSTHPHVIYKREIHIFFRISLHYHLNYDIIYLCV